MRRRNELSGSTVISTSWNDHTGRDSMEPGIYLVPDNPMANRGIWSNGALHHVPSVRNLVRRSAAMAVVWRFLVHGLDEPPERFVVACIAGRKPACKMRT